MSETHLSPIHVCPSAGGHDTDGETCWCKPSVVQGCPECGGYKAEHEGSATPDCWRCGGAGLVDPFTPDMANLVIHKDIPSSFLSAQKYISSHFAIEGFTAS